jgi:hypothetical protein
LQTSNWGSEAGWGTCRRAPGQAGKVRRTQVSRRLNLLPRAGDCCAGPTGSDWRSAKSVVRSRQGPCGGGAFRKRPEPPGERPKPWSRRRSRAPAGGAFLLPVSNQRWALLRRCSLFEIPGGRQPDRFFGLRSPIHQLSPKLGSTCPPARTEKWIPAFAGMTSGVGDAQCFATRPLSPILPKTSPIIATLPRQLVTLRGVRTCL